MIATFIRYNIVQIIAYGCDFGSFWVLTNLFCVAPLPVNVAGKLAAGLLAFVLHKRFTFDAAGSGSTKSEATRYFILIAFNIPLSSLVMMALIAVLPLAISKVAGDVVGVLVTFALVRQAVFRRTQESTTSKS